MYMLISMIDFILRNIDIDVWYWYLATPLSWTDFIAGVSICYANSKLLLGYLKGCNMCVINLKLRSRSDIATILMDYMEINDVHEY